MIVVAITALTLMAAANYWIAGRFLYPPVVFCSVWAGDLGLVWAAGKTFYPLSDKTLVIFCVGGLVFSVGGAIALMLPQKATVEQPPGKSSDLILSLLVVIVCCSAPFVLRWIIDLASSFSVATFLLAARMAMLETNESQDASATFFGNFVTLASIVAMIAFLRRDHGKIRAFAALSVGVVLNILIGARSGIGQLILSLLCIDWITHGRVRWKAVLVMVLVLVIVFGAMAIALQKGDASAEASLAENAGPVLEGFVLYGAGGIVAFDRVVRQPNIIPHNWQVNRVFLETANKIGGHFDIPSIHSDYVDVGPNGLSQNVYTMYFAYLDLGYVWMMSLVAFVGFAITLIYRKADIGSEIWIVVFSFFFYGLLLTPFSDNFFGGLNLSIKIFAVTWLIYKFPPKMGSMLAALGRVKAEPARP